MKRAISNLISFEIIERMRPIEQRIERQLDLIANETNSAQNATANAVPSKRTRPKSMSTDSEDMSEVCYCNKLRRVRFT